MRRYLRNPFRKLLSISSRSLSRYHQVFFSRDSLKKIGKISTLCRNSEEISRGISENSMEELLKWSLADIPEEIPEILKMHSWDTFKVIPKENWSPVVSLYNLRKYSSIILWMNIWRNPKLWSKFRKIIWRYSLRYLEVDCLEKFIVKFLEKKILRKSVHKVFEDFFKSYPGVICRNSCKNVW